ncbi:hypothetical protein R6Q59_010918 [Mikania micrantha]
MLIEKHNLDNDINACMEKLVTLGWEEFDAKYQTALLLFGESSDIRKVWLRLQPHTCELWVRNAGAKYVMVHNGACQQAETETETETGYQNER